MPCAWLEVLFPFVYPLDCPPSAVRPQDTRILCRMHQFTFLHGTKKTNFCERHGWQTLDTLAPPHASVCLSYTPRFVPTRPLFLADVSLLPVVEIAPWKCAAVAVYHYPMDCPSSSVRPQDMGPLRRVHRSTFLHGTQKTNFVKARMLGRSFPLYRMRMCPFVYRKPLLLLPLDPVHITKPTNSLENLVFTAIDAFERVRSFRLKKGHLLADEA